MLHRPHKAKHHTVHHRRKSHVHEHKERKPRPLISIEMVSKTYSNDPLDFKTLILKNIYLEIMEGEFLMIFGPSGSGKSTLLNILAGLEAPTAGRILVRRRDLSKFNDEELARYHRLRMGMVFQQFNLIKSLNVWENVALPQTANSVNYKLRKSRALRLLKLLHIDHYADRHPNEISGGEQQRVAIARALINNPYFLLVDEPTGNLDSKSAEEVMNILYELNVNDGRTIVLVTHNPDQLRYASRIVYMQDGKILIEERKERERPDIATTSDGGVLLTKKAPMGTLSGPAPVSPSAQVTPPTPPVVASPAVVTKAKESESLAVGSSTKEKTTDTSPVVAADGKTPDLPAAPTDTPTDTTSAEKVKEIVLTETTLKK